MAQSVRAEKVGFARDAQNKMAAKWDADRAKTAVSWIGERIGEPLSTSGTMEDVHELLKDGLRLAKLANWVKPGSIPASKLGVAPKMAFKQMELIGLFLKAIDDLLKRDDSFQTVDLYESQNMVQVIITIESLGRALLNAGREGFGVAESKGTAHQWTEEDLKKGQSIIGLQMGSNKGASQSGQNFGKSRSIMD
ncbi:hypothetical protein EGW08_010446 [Elysia chlorotica]|uniref:Transgelin n=1 Tax=Elysia chlorotica TaxID=188477 RepID=A0A433TJP5_ELYCH|nr:hypothetical protein EGW08_010446 [Elysia chlorotica]